MTTNWYDNIPPQGTLVKDVETFIYEIKNVSHDEVYFSIGLFFSLDAAISAIKTIDNHGNDFSCDDNDFSSYEIVKRKTAMLHHSDDCKKVYSIEFKKIYNDETDEHEWIITNEKIND